MNTVRAAGVLAILCCLPGAARSAEPANAFGLGLKYCGNLLEEIARHPDYAINVSDWAAGYFTGRNAGEITADGLFRDARPFFSNGVYSMTGLVIRECRITPHLPVIAVVERLFLVLPQQRWIND